MGSWEFGNISAFSWRKEKLTYGFQPWWIWRTDRKYALHVLTLLAGLDTRRETKKDPKQVLHDSSKPVLLLWSLLCDFWVLGVGSALKGAVAWRPEPGCGDTPHTCSSLCFVPLPPLQYYLGQNLRIKKRKKRKKEIFGAQLCHFNFFSSCWGRFVRILWGTKGRVRGIKPLTLYRRHL